MKNLLKKINYFFSSLIRNHRTSPELSKIINHYLDDPKTTIKISSSNTCILENPKFKSLSLWINNYPYAYGNVFNSYSTIEQYDTYKELVKILGEKLPDRKTVYRLHEAVEEKKKELGYYPGSIEETLRKVLNV